jgi:hypothetical protein
MQRFSFKNALTDEVLLLLLVLSIPLFAAAATAEGTRIEGGPSVSAIAEPSVAPSASSSLSGRDCPCTVTTYMAGVLVMYADWWRRTSQTLTSFFIVI